MTDEEYYEFIQPYEDAKQMLLTRLDVLNHNLYGEASARPIHNIQCRIKKKQSIEEKLQRKGKEPTVMNAKDYLQDIAGVRVISNEGNPPRAPLFVFSYHVLPDVFSAFASFFSCFVSWQ